MNHSELREILQKKDRNPEELATLKGFLGRNKFFSQLFDEHKNQPEIIWGIVKALKHKVLEPFSLVFKQGDKGDQAYIVIEGKIIVSIKEDVDMFANMNDAEKEKKEQIIMKDQEKEKEKPKNVDSNDQIYKQAQSLVKQIKNYGNIKHPETIKKENNDVKEELKKYEGTAVGRIFGYKNKGLVFSKFLNDIQVNMMTQEEKEQYEKLSQAAFIHYYEKEFGKIILEQGENSFFGEKALVENKPRAASICTIQKTDFMILEKTDFEVVISEFKTIQTLKNQFLINLFPIFSTLVTSGKTFERIVRFFNEDLTYRKQTIIKEGEVFNYNTAKVYLIQDGEFQVFKRVKVTMQSNRQLPHQVYHQICLGTLVSGEFFGEEIIFQDDGVYQYSIQCTSSQGKIMFLDKNILLKKLPEQIKEVIVKKWYPKDAYRKQLFAEMAEKKEFEEQEERKQAEIIIRHKGLQNKIQQYQQIYQQGGDQQDIDENYKQQQMLKYQNQIQNQDQKSQNQKNNITSNQSQSYQVMNNFSNSNTKAGLNISSIQERKNMNNLNQNQTIEQSGILGPLNQTEDQNITNKLQETLINQSKALQETIDQSGLTAIMMTNNQKHVLKQDFKQLINPDLGLKYNYLSSKLNYKAQTSQKVDPFPFISKEATVIRALKEEYEGREKKKFTDKNHNYHTAATYNQIVKNFNQVKNAQNYNDFLKNSLNLQDNYIQNLHLQQQQGQNNNKNHFESKYTYIPGQNPENQQSLQPKLSNLVQRISKTRQNDIQNTANIPKIQSSVYQSKYPPIQPYSNNSYQMQNQEDNIYESMQNSEQFQPSQYYQQQQQLQQQQQSEFSQKNKFLGSFYRSQSPNEVQLAITTHGWNNSRYCRSASPIHIDQVDLRLGQNILKNKLPEINQNNQKSSQNIQLIGLTKPKNLQSADVKLQLQASLRKKQKLLPKRLNTTQNLQSIKVNQIHEKSQSLDNKKKSFLKKNKGQLVSSPLHKNNQKLEQITQKQDPDYLDDSYVPLNQRNLSSNKNNITDQQNKKKSKKNK